MLRSKSLMYAAALIAVASTASAKPRIRLGGFSVSAGYSQGWGAYPYWGFGPFGYPYWGGPMFAPGYFNAFAYAPSFGEVKLGRLPARGSVYLDGGYAGDVAKLKHIWLEPGVYNLEVREGSHSTFEKKIYVLSGKTLTLRSEDTGK